ncbi:MAG: GerMN domain-containing protein [Dictyoglomaceae bacterium]
MRRFFIILLLFVFCISLIFFVGLKEKIETKIYFYDPKTLRLVPEERNFEFSKWQSLFRREYIAREVLLSLIEGPKDLKLRSPIPLGTKILGVSVKNNIAYVNFSDELKRNHPGGSLGEMLTVYSIVNTLTELSWIKKVQILINGAIVESLAGHIDLSEPLERDLSLTK